jgi:hypothetical protein
MALVGVRTAREQATSHIRVVDRWTLIRILVFAVKSRAFALAVEGLGRSSGPNAAFRSANTRLGFLHMK